MITASPSIGARVTHSVNQSISDATETSLAFDTERYDTDTIHDAVTNNSRLTAKTAGKYLIVGQAYMAASDAGIRYFVFRLNGVTYIGITEWDTAQGSVTAMHSSTIYDMAVDDYVECRVYQSSGGALNVNAAGNYTPEFMMQKIGS